jgi:hypothetical protein
MFGTDLPVAWVYYADRYYIVARLMFFTELLLEVPVSAHRAMELYLKAFLVSKGESVTPKGAAWGHNLSELQEHCANHDPSFNDPDLHRRLSYFQRYFDLVRYPSSIDGKLNDGTGIWFSFDACVIPLDEVVAFVRPRIVLSGTEWGHSWLSMISLSSEPRWSYQKKALQEANQHLVNIICMQTQASSVKFLDFSFDKPGC